MGKPKKKGKTPSCLTSEVSRDYPLAFLLFFKAGLDAPWPGLCFIIVYLELKTHGLDGDPKYLGVPIVFSFVDGCVLE